MLRCFALLLMSLAVLRASDDLCLPTENDFIFRDDRPYPLPRPFWRKLLPPIVTAYIKKKRQTKSFSKIETSSAMSSTVRSGIISSSTMISLRT